MEKVSRTDERRPEIRSKRQTKQDLRKAIEMEDSELVEGVFRCYEPVGGSMFFHQRKYPNNVFKKTLCDGVGYSVPKFVARYINRKCSTTKYEYANRSNDLYQLRESGRSIRASFITNVKI
jgi:hypothetical protein